MRAAIVVLLLSGCATVQPWERGDLARPCMAAAFAESALDAAHRDKVVQTQTAAGLPGSAPGGGCGCTQ